MDVRQYHPNAFCHVLSSSNAPKSYIHFFPSSTFFSSLQMFRFSQNSARLASGQCFFSNFLTTRILLSRLLVSLPLSDLASEFRLAVDYLKQTFPGSDLWKCLIETRIACRNALTCAVCASDKVSRTSDLEARYNFKL